MPVARVGLHGFFPSSKACAVLRPTAPKGFSQRSFGFPGAASDALHQIVLCWSGAGGALRETRPPAGAARRVVRKQPVFTNTVSSRKRGHPDTPKFQSHRERTRAVPLPAERSAVQSSMRRTMRTSIVRRSLGSRSVSTSSLPKNRQPVIVSAVRTPIGRCVSGSPPSLLQPGPGRRDPCGAEHQDSYPVAFYPLCCHGAALAPALSRSRLAGTQRGVSRRL